MRDKHNQRAYDLIPVEDEECRLFIRQAESAATQAADVASGELKSSMLIVPSTHLLQIRMARSIQTTWLPTELVPFNESLMIWIMSSS